MKLYLTIDSKEMTVEFRTHMSVGKNTKFVPIPQEKLSYNGHAVFEYDRATLNEVVTCIIETPNKNVFWGNAVKSPHDQHNRPLARVVAFYRALDKLSISSSTDCAFADAILAAFNDKVRTDIQCGRMKRYAIRQSNSDRAIPENCYEPKPKNFELAAIRAKKRAAKRARRKAAMKGNANDQK